VLPMASVSWADEVSIEVQRKSLGGRTCKRLPQEPFTCLAQRNLETQTCARLRLNARKPTPANPKASKGNTPGSGTAAVLVWLGRGVLKFTGSTGRPGQRL
jgi:hypothetical protein